MDADDRRGLWRPERRDQRPQQDTAECSARPLGTVEHPMVVLEMRLGLQACHSQSAADRALSGCRSRSCEQHDCPFPYASAEHRGTSAQNGYDLAGQGEHLSPS